ncbi:MAG: hypothetical protein ACAH95_07020 [Fimbriimonas sp.]
MAAAIVVIGCAGGGDSGGTATSGGSATGLTTGNTLRVNIPTPTGYVLPPGFLELGFLTGQGRAIGDLTLIITRATVQDEYGEVTNPLAQPVALALGSYSFQIARLVVPFTDQNSRLFENYVLDPLRLEEETGGQPNQISDNCFATENPDGSFNRAWPPNPTPMVARVFPGRSTLVPFFIDDSMFRIASDPTPPPGDPCGGTLAVFDQNRFNELNETPVQGFINDYVSFDISGVPAAERPVMSDGTLVGRVFSSGDNYAVSPASLSGHIELLTPQVTEPIIGNYGPPGTIGGSTHPGTFTLQQLDPTDLFNLRKIVALQGIWREYTNVITGLDTWNMITFPNTLDATEQEAVFFRRDGSGVITSFFFGYVDYDTDTGHFFPVRTLVSGISDPAAEVTISITGQFDKRGNSTQAAQLTRTGNYTVTVPGGLPADAPSGGSFLVFRI